MTHCLRIHASIRVRGFKNGERAISYITAVGVLPRTDGRSSRC